MQISQVSRARPGGVNEDYACAGTDWALLLDGATPVAGARTGCVHDVPWLVRQLAAALSARLIGNREATLADLLGEAIEQASAAHAGSCDLANPDSPSSTVSMVRLRGDDLEYLVLADSPVVLCGRDGDCRVIVDDRIAQLPGGQPYDAALVRASRNCAGGFWVASTSPDAARHAITGIVPVLDLAAAGLFSDGASRMADRYGYSWPGIFGLLRSAGPGHLVTLLRAAEGSNPLPDDKQHDDATAVYLRLRDGS